ncbi:hypothetical protein Ancab_000921 [Ancistrocladus abbreviatus]
MYRHGRGLRFLTSASATQKKTTWDPISSLTLNHPTLILLEKCNSRRHFKQILAQMMRNNLTSQTFPMSRLLYFSAISHAENLDLGYLLLNYFTPNPNLYIYNTMISASSSSSFSNQSFALYNSMLRSSIYPDKHTLVYLLQACGCLSIGKQIHSHAIVTGLCSYAYLLNSLIKMYMENGDMGCARNVFEQMPDPDTVSFNIMLVEYAKKGRSLESVGIFREMMRLGFEPDGFTMLGLLISSGHLGDLRLGKSIHAWIERRGCLLASNLILGNAILDMYVKCEKIGLAGTLFGLQKETDAISWNTMMAGYVKIGNLDLACDFFDKMPKRDLVSWNSLIAGYARTGDYMTLRRLIHEMLAENVRPDEVSMINLVSATAEVGLLDQGKQVHGWAVRMLVKINAFLSSALIDMYSKCGNVETAFKVFNRVTEMDVAVWTTMISGFAFHGYGNCALDMFFEMQMYVMPNHVTLVAILTACSHSGFVDEGLNIFRSMKDRYNIEPRLEHYGCLVDLLVRSGKVEDAINVIEKMPMKPSQSIWGSVLGACRTKNMEIAKLASAELLKLEPEEEGGYILLSNMYASCGKWRHSDKIREIMDSQGIKKTAGSSCLAINGVEHEFLAADKSHLKWKDLRSILLCLRSQMKMNDNFSVEFSYPQLYSC